MLDVKWYNQCPANLVNDLLQVFTLKCTSEKCLCKLYQSHAIYRKHYKNHQSPNEYLCEECATERRLEEIGFGDDLEELPQAKMIRVCEEFIRTHEMLC